MGICYKWGLDMGKLYLAVWILLAFCIEAMANNTDEKLLLRDVNDSNFEALYDFVDKNAPSEDAFVALQRIVGQYIYVKDWDAAIDTYGLFKGMFPNKKEEISKIIEILKAKEEGIKEENQGGRINSRASEFTPILRADMSKMYFTVYSRDFSKKGDDNIFVSNYSEKDGWQAAKRLEGSISTPRSEAAQSLSVDGKTMLVYGNYADNLGRGDLYEFNWDGAKWSDKTHIPYPINTKHYDGDATVSADGNAMFFVSERPGGIGETHWVGSVFHGSMFGNTDIYVCEKTKNGWGKPINLGAVINTPYAERKPQLHPDGKTLYFSSEGHPGLGRLDVFVSRRLSEDSWTEWSEPVNLGKEINGPGRDWGFFVIPDGNYAYFSSSDKTVNIGQSDIYRTKIPDFAKPYPVVAINGIVVDQNGQPLKAEIIWEDLGADKELSRIYSDAEDGSFFYILPVGKIFGYHAEKEGYYPISKNIDLSKTNKYTQVTDTLTMINIEDLLEGSVRINNIFFEYDKAVLKPESFPELKRLVKMLKGFPEVKVEISGHTDNIGSEDYNMTLSEARAEAVINFLKGNGLEHIEFIAKGYGKSMPVANNSSEDGRSLNRRVEFRVIKGK